MSRKEYFEEWALLFQIHFFPLLPFLSLFELPFSPLFLVLITQLQQYLMEKSNLVWKQLPDHRDVHSEGVSRPKTILSIINGQIDLLAK